MLPSLFMKLLYLHQYFTTPKGKSGTRSYEFAKRLIDKGYDVTIVTTSAALENEGTFTKGWNELTIDKVRVYAYHLPYSNNDPFYKRIYKFLAFSIVSCMKVKNIHADLVFATSTPLTIAIPALFKKLLHKTPFIFEVRDLWPDVPIAMGIVKNQIAIKVLKIFEKYTYKSAKHIIALSPGMKDGVVNTGISPEKVTVIPNSSDTKLFDVPKSIGENYKQSKLSFVGERKLVIYPGSFGMVNKVDYIVDLARSAKNSGYPICFLAIGAGNQKNAVIELAKKHNVLNDNLYILEPISKNEIVQLFSSADLCLSLVGPIKAFWNNSANKVFDSLASQTPIAINHQGWQKDFIERTGCGLVLNENIEESASRINNFLNNSSMYLEAVNACKSLSYNDFSRDILFEKLYTTIENNKK